MLPETLVAVKANDIRRVVEAHHTTTLAAQSPFRQEEDVAVTLRCEHGLLLSMNMAEVSPKGLYG